jgi:hypothetical protein
MILSEKSAALGNRPGSYKLRTEARKCASRGKETKFFLETESAYSRAVTSVDCEDPLTTVTAISCESMYYKFETPKQKDRLFTKKGKENKVWLLEYSSKSCSNSIAKV